MTEPKNEKEGDVMSFVGIVLDGDRVIGFGDTKTTTVLLGNCYEDEPRGHIRKVFSNGKLIVTAYDENMVASPSGGAVGIEKWIPENIGDFREPVPLMLRFQKAAGIKGSYGFICGWLEDGESHARHFRVRGGELTIGPDMTQTDWKPFVLTGGYWFYDNEVEATVLASRIAQAGDSDPERVITGFIREASDRLDESGAYNPVGGKILFERIGK